MSRRRKPLIPEAREELDHLQTKLLSEELGQKFQSKEEAKLELANKLGVL